MVTAGDGVVEPLSQLQGTWCNDAAAAATPDCMGQVASNPGGYLSVRGPLPGTSSGNGSTDQGSGQNNGGQTGTWLPHNLNAPDNVPATAGR
jgi:hypothetical protein